MQKSPGQKPDWLLAKRLVSSKYLKSKLNLIFSEILEQIGSNDTGGQFFIYCFSFSLWTGAMLTLLHSLGKHSPSRHVLKSIANGFEIKEAHTFIMRIDISLCPWALLGSNDLIIFTIPPEQISKVDSLSLFFKLVFAETKLLFSIVVHY